MKKLFNILLYFSFAFLVYYLYSNNFLKIPQDVNWGILLMAVIVLVIGNVFQCMCWRDLLADQGIRISKKEAIVSHGLSAFMKYIPGKVMTIVGRAAYVAKVTGCELKESSLGSFKTQILELIFGTIIGLMVFAFVDIDVRLVLISILMLVSLLSMLFFMRPFLKLTIWIAGKLGKELSFEPFSVKFTLIKVILFSLHWCCWGTGFFLLAKSVSPDIPFYVIFVFPLATVLGIAAIFSPGGIGVREGTLTLLLVFSGVELELATSIAVFSRLWFLIGDLSIFSIASIVSRMNKS